MYSFTEGWTMFKIDLGKLKEKSDDLAAFLEKKLFIKPSIKGNDIILNDEGAKDKLKKNFLKTYLKRYLHLNDLRSYRILIEGNELRLVELKVKED